MSESISQSACAIDVVIPALNEERSIGDVLDEIPQWVRRVVVVDNGSTDATALAARSRQAHVVHEPRRGYGAACLRGLVELSEPDIVVFLDADRSDRPQEMDQLLQPILKEGADLVIGSRVLGHAERGSLTLPQRLGNHLASALIRCVWGVQCTDLGPFRAIRFDAIKQLGMTDLDYGWTVQMQARAARMKMKMIEVPVSYRKRTGTSKISGTVRGVVGAGTKILGTIACEAARRRSINRPHERLVIFSRLPVAGTTKTRLIPAFGAQGAADLQEEMTRHTLDVARRWRRGPRTTVEVRFTGGSAEAMQSVFGDDVSYVDQGGGSLGERLSRALPTRNADADGRTVIIGSDCPGITPLILRRAFAALNTCDAVIGPAMDGGYYLIGLRTREARVFQDIDWGSASVCAQTMERCRAAGLRLAVLERLTDVDEPDDLPAWDAIATERSGDGRSRALSVVIPTFNEEAHLEAALRSVGSRPDTEVIVTDGGSTDRTLRIARAHGARLVSGQGGRGVQMNAGAAVARGEVLLFLHADTRLPFAYHEEINRVLAGPAVVAGAFRLAFDHVSRSLRVIELGANLRSRWRALPYGDQAMFLPRTTFNRLGGFKPWPVMEDYEFALRLGQHGRIGLAASAVVTSARRWRQDGAWRTTLRHQVAILRYRLGYSPETIARGLNREITSDGGTAMSPNRLNLPTRSGHGNSPA